MHTFEHEIAAANEARIQKRLEAIYESITPMRGERATKVVFFGTGQTWATRTLLDGQGLKSKETRRSHGDESAPVLRRLWINT